jgi:hypothetical protein
LGSRSGPRHFAYASRENGPDVPKLPRLGRISRDEARLDSPMPRPRWATKPIRMPCSVACRISIAAAFPTTFTGYAPLASPLVALEVLGVGVKDTLHDDSGRLLEARRVRVRQGLAPGSPRRPRPRR